MIEVVKIADQVIHILKEREEEQGEKEQDNISEDQQSSEELHQILRSFMKSLEYIATVLTESLSVNDTISVSTQHIGFSARRVTPANLTITSTKESNQHMNCCITDESQASSKILTNTTGYQAVMKISKESLRKHATYSIYVFAFDEAFFFMNNLTKVTSGVLTVTLTNERLVNVSKPIEIWFTSKYPSTQVDCVYWDVNKSR